MNSTARGQHILKTYKTLNSFLPDTRAKLVEIIVDEIFRRGLPKGNKTAITITSKIIELFPTEDEVLSIFVL